MTLTHPKRTCRQQKKKKKTAPPTSCPQKLRVCFTMILGRKDRAHTNLIVGGNWFAGAVFFFCLRHVRFVWARVRVGPLWTGSSQDRAPYGLVPPTLTTLHFLAVRIVRAHTHTHTFLGAAGWRALLLLLFFCLRHARFGWVRVWLTYSHDACVPQAKNKTKQHQATSAENCVCMQHPGNH